MSTIGSETNSNDQTDKTSPTQFTESSTSENTSQDSDEATSPDSSSDENTSSDSSRCDTSAKMMHQAIANARTTYLSPRGFPMARVEEMTTVRWVDQNAPGKK